MTSEKSGVCLAVLILFQYSMQRTVKLYIKGDYCIPVSAVEALPYCIDTNIHKYFISYMYIHRNIYTRIHVHVVLIVKKKKTTDLNKTQYSVHTLCMLSSVARVFVCENHKLAQLCMKSVDRYCKIATERWNTCITNVSFLYNHDNE